MFLTSNSHIKLGGDGVIIGGGIRDNAVYIEPSQSLSKKKTENPTVFSEVVFIYSPEYWCSAKKGKNSYVCKNLA